MSAEPIAAVVGDILAGRIRPIRPPHATGTYRAVQATPSGREPGTAVDHAEVVGQVLTAVTLTAKSGADVVDATAVHAANLGRSVDLYGDHPCVAPPFDAALISYVNSHGNVVVLSTLAQEMTPGLRRAWDTVNETGQRGPWASPNPIRWDDVRWTIKATMIVGGRSRARGRLATAGPVMDLWLAVYADGEPADLHWVDFTHTAGDAEPEMFQAAGVTFLGVLNFLNCRNVTLAEPERPRAERRRLARDHPDVTVKVLTVTAPGASGGGRPLDAPHAGQALHTVRGHFGHYGDCCPGRHDPKGLLFGRLEGRYWRPQRAQGSADHGTVHKAYRPDPEAAR